MGIKRVWAILNDGRRYEGDILIGADGIWSKVGIHLHSGRSNPPWYHCYYNAFVAAHIPLRTP